VVTAALVLPFVTVDRFRFGFLTIHSFAVLVGGGVLTGFYLAVRRAALWRISRERIALFSLFLIVGGIIGARFGRILYEPDLVHKALTDPAEVFLRFHGIASFGAYAGGLGGALLYFRLRCKSIAESLKFLDAVGFALPFGWFFGRVGCALVHDHPGILSDGWMAVAFPGGSRYDLGLLEAIFLFVLAMAFLVLSRWRWSAGFFFGLYCCVYGPFRFFLDQLHVNPPRYFGLSVDQYGAVLALTAGLVTFYFSGATDSQQPTPEKIHVRTVRKP